MLSLFSRLFRKKKMKVSIITPTIRKQGLDLVRNSLKKQTFTDFEWLIGSPFNPKIKEARWVKDDFNGGIWTLNRIYGELFKEAKGELIVSWQDYIWAYPDALEKFWRAYKATDGIITGVGDQYDQLDEYGKPCHKVWSDPRKRTDLGTFYEINFDDVEWNFACVPKRFVEEAGGIDTELDFLGYGGDLYQLADRLNDMGKRFYIDQLNESFTLRHRRERKDWDEKHILFTGAYEKRKQELKEKGQWPILTLK